MDMETIGKYVDLELLGRGGMAEVYCGRDPNLNRQVAIKVILPHLTTEVSFEQRFRQEARLVAALRHTNIVQVYEYDFHEGQPFMVMEYFPVGTLRDLLAEYKARGETMPLGLVGGYLEAIASALDYAHTRNAVHRDIKPANILFSSAGDPVISDFGIAKLLDESMHLTVTGDIIGSPYYMSPEQAAGQPVTKFSDIYSLGVVVYEMVVGRVPFVGESITGVLLQHINDPPPPVRDFNPNIPRPLGAAIDKVLAKAPAERFPSASDFSQAFNKALAGEIPMPTTPVEDTVLEGPPEALSSQPTAPDLSATVPDIPESSLSRSPETSPPEPGLAKTAGGRRRWPLLLGLIAAFAVLAGLVFVFNSGISSLFGLGGAVAGEGEVLLYTSLNDQEAITSPQVGSGGYSSLMPEDFVPGRDGSGVLFNRQVVCGTEGAQEVSFPAWDGDETNVDLEAGELAFWYQPHYEATDTEGVYTLANITLDGDSPPSIILFFNDGYFNLNAVDSEGNWWGTSAGYRDPLWAGGDWVHIRAVWDSTDEQDSLRLYVDDLRVDSGDVPGGWGMDAGERAIRIYIGSNAPCGEEVANGIIDEFVIRRLP